jgi:hypothetical protein
MANRLRADMMDGNQAAALALAMLVMLVMLAIVYTAVTMN